MKFKHTFHVFVDNFSVIYKQLLYRLIIFTVATTIGTLGLYGFLKDLINSESLVSLTSGIKNFISSLLNGDVTALSDISEQVRTAYGHFLELLQTRMTQIVLSILLIIVLYIVQKWFAGLGNYSTAVLINDKMALRANSPFVGSMISNLKEAAIYNLIYVPLSFVYDFAIAAIMITFLYYLVIQNVMPLIIGVFVFMLILTVSTAFKMTFTCDWLPALIRGKMGQRKSIAYTFNRKNKNTMNVFSNFVVLVLIIMSVNVAAALTTFGVGLLLTIPSSYVILVCFEMVNYYDREELKYFVDKNTVIKPDRERVLTREEFFRGNDENS